MYRPFDWIECKECRVFAGQMMWSGFDRFSLKQDASSHQETTLGDAEHISTIAGSLASIGTGHTETPVNYE